MKRRTFLVTAGAIGCSFTHSIPRSSFAQDTAIAIPSKTPPPITKDWLWKTLKIGMIQSGSTLTEKFQIAKEAGFVGVELDVPSLDVDQANAAAKETGLIIDGTVGDYHWNVRHTDPDESVRSQALANLKESLRKTALIGADTMLLVPGHGQDGTSEEVMQRSSEAIRSALPDAEKHGVKILIENVWNHFLYEHDGPNNQSAQPLADYIDSFDSPWVGVQFDIGNHWKYGDPAEWIRTLGKRIIKLDIKGFSRAQNDWAAITQGDIDWPKVKNALREIGYQGWLAAEVGGGDLAELKVIGRQMDSALDCTESIS